MCIRDRIFQVASFLKARHHLCIILAQRLIKQSWKAARIFESRFFWGLVFCILAHLVPTVYLNGTKTWSITVPIWSKRTRGKIYPFQNIEFPNVLFYAISSFFLDSKWLSYGHPKHAFLWSSESSIFENLKASSWSSSWCHHPAVFLGPQDHFSRIAKFFLVSSYSDLLQLCHPGLILWCWSWKT